MVKVAGPAMSIDASGKVAGALVFSKWKGRNYARVLVKPRNPRTGGQKGMRAMFKFLSQIWNGLADADKLTWKTRADTGVYSTFNAFMSHNQFRWRNFKTPTKQDPATETGTAPTGPTGVATPGERLMTLAITDGASPPDFGYAIFRSLTETFTLGWDNCIAVVPWDSGGVTTYIDTPLDPGTYYYNAIGFLDTGLNGADGTEFNGEVT